MNELYVKSILAGIMFGIWPLLMNRSGLSGNVSSAVFSAIVFLGILPFAVMTSGATLATANWVMVIVAGCLGAIGLLFFNGMLARATSQNVGSLFVTMLVVQISLPALYQVVILGQVSPRKIAGFLAAVLTAILLV